MTPSNPPAEYMLFFRGPDWDAGLDVDQTQRTLDSVMAWCEAVQRQGKVKGGLALAREGRLVSAKKESLVLDGPFAESKEAIGGYLLVQVADLEEAVAIAQSCPTLEHGISIEVRPALSECPITKRLRERRIAAAA